MTTVALRLDPVFKKFPTISGEAQKIATALAAVESGARLASGFSPYALACQNLISSSTRLRTAHKELDAALQALSLRVQAATAKIGPSEFLVALRADDVRSVQNMLKISDLQNKKLSNGELPLHFAIRSGSSEVVKYLLSNAGVNPLSKDHQGLTAFDHAFIKNDKKMIALVLGSTLGTQIPESAIPAKGDVPELQLISREIAGLLRPPVSKLPPLHAAAFLDDLKGLEQLTGSDLNGVDANGMTALHYAVLGGREAVVKWLLAKGAKLDAKASNGMNLLHFAAISGSEAILKRLLDTKKFDLNAADGRGRTPLHFAIAGEKIAAARALIERGGDPLAKTMQTTPFAILEVVSRIRSEMRDPLKLDRSSLYMLGSFAASAACHYFGDAKAEGLRQYLPIAGKVLSALPVLNSLYKTSRSGGNLLKILPAGMGFTAALFGYILDNRSSKSFFEGGHTLYLGKTLIDNLQHSWKNSALETYRPLRNALVHTANTLFAAYAFLSTSGIKKTMVCKLGTSEQCIHELKPKYEQPQYCRGLEEGVDSALEDLCDPTKRDNRVQICQDEYDKEYPNAPLENDCKHQFPKENIATCTARLKKEACEAIFPVEESANCKARMKPKLDERTGLCRQEALEASADAKTLLGLSGDPDHPDKAQQILFAQFQGNAGILEKIKQAYDTITQPPPRYEYFNPFEFDCTGMLQENCIKNAGEKLFNVECKESSNTCFIRINEKNVKHYDRSLIEPTARLVLGIDKGHSLDQCKTAFKNLAKMYHPDKQPSASRERYQELIRKITSAKEVLCPK